MAYIPQKHEKYDLLPYCRANGGEVFEYPSDLISNIEKIIGFSEAIFPYNFDSYEDYYSSIDNEIETHKKNSELVNLLLLLKERVRDMNIKEEWSVLRYLGESNDDILGLTRGKVYYWPTSKNNPVYQGVVDNEEFTSYMYPTDSSMWEILEDPTGMAFNTIYKKAYGSLSVEEYEHVMAQLNDFKEND